MNKRAKQQSSKRALCTYCDLRLPLNPDGRLPFHGSIDGRCPGSETNPEQIIRRAALIAERTSERSIPPSSKQCSLPSPSDTRDSAIEFIAGIAKDARFSNEYLGNVVRSWLPTLESSDESNPSNLALQKGADVLWERQFKGTPWEGKVGLIRPDSMEEYRALAYQVWKAVSGISAVETPPEYPVPPQEQYDVSKWSSRDPAPRLDIALYDDGALCVTRHGTDDVVYEMPAVAALDLAHKIIARSALKASGERT